MRTRRLLIFVLPVLLLVAAGVYILHLSAQAQSASDYYSETHLSYAPGSDGNYDAGQTLEAWLYSDFRPGLGGTQTTGQSRLVIFSDPNFVDFIGWECNPNARCYESGWDNVLATYNGRKDLKLCISFPIEGWQSGGQMPNVAILRYRVKDPATSSFMVQLTEGHGNGTCEQNPFANGIPGDHGSGACFNNRFGGAGCQGLGVGFIDAQPNGFTGGFGINNPAKTQAPLQQAPNNSGGGGGSSASTPSEQPASVPAVAPQGSETKQPKITPSPFYDGKLYASGSNAPTDENKATVAGLKVGYVWLILLATLVLSAGGFVTWKWWRSRIKS